MAFTGWVTGTGVKNNTMRYAVIIDGDGLSGLLDGLYKSIHASIDKERKLGLYGQDFPPGTIITGVTYQGTIFKCIVLTPGCTVIANGIEY